MSVRLKILLSYHYYKDTDLDDLIEKKFAPHYPEVFLDSGGFSAMTQGASIDINAYAAFIKRFAHRLAVYANLDAIGNAEKTADNQKRLEDMGLRPIPVFHTSEDFKWLDGYIERYPYIALGGLVPYIQGGAFAWKKVFPWIISAFKRTHGHAALHGFGVTNWHVLSRLPWYSVDSSTWVNGFRFGCLKLFDDTIGAWKDIHVGDKGSCQKHEGLIKRYGYSAARLGDRSGHTRKDLCAVSAIATRRSEEWLRRRHGLIRRNDSDAVGIRVYMADPTGTDTASASAILNRRP